MTLTTERGGVDDAVVADIIALVGEALSEIKCIGSERMARTGLSMSHWHVLMLLARHGEMSMSRLAEAQQISLSNATGLVDRLVERGLVERFGDPDDRRVVLIRVSDAGRQLLEKVDLLREDFIRRVVGRLDATRLRRLHASLGDVRDAIGVVMSEDPDPELREHLDSYAHAVSLGLRTAS
ncbi:MAG TPA: MarR family transcriptional regulator [Candidatus Limnocylindrales bacterium]|nr:MarR family transcriptional regulator [Candidatus Limnocylindrales bacterium]